MAGKQVILWHIAVSHYSEKVRWALDYKAVAHERRAPMPGPHMLVAAWVTRGRALTLPVARIDGETIADSSAIIAALERRFPDPPLLPSDEGARRRALQLEDWFDRNLGPYIRRFVFHELRRDPDRMEAIARSAAPDLAQRLGSRLVPVSNAMTGVRYLASGERAAERARQRVLVALDRLEHELGGEEYLVGGRFTIADLTAASLLYPLVLPAEAETPIERMPAPVEALRAQVRERPGYRWVQETFRRHRRSRDDAVEKGAVTTAPARHTASSR
jgi:glutathione S-transferase